MEKIGVRKSLLLIALICTGVMAKAQQETQSLKLTLEQALEIALTENPTIKVANQDIELKKVSQKEAWQN